MLNLLPPKFKHSGHPCYIVPHKTLALFSAVCCKVIGLLYVTSPLIFTLVWFALVVG